MMRNAVRTISGTALVSIMIVMLALCGCSSGEPTPSASVDPDWLADQASVVSVTGKVKPQQYATLSFGASGVVESVSVSEGDTVSQGQELARLDAPELQAAYGQARVALDAAQAQFSLLQEGTRQEDINRANAAIFVAKANLEIAQASQYAHEPAITQSEAAVVQARASLSLLQAGATADEIELSRQQVEQAKAVRYGLQGQRDVLDSQQNRPGYQSGSFEAAEGQVFAADNTVKIAELSHEILLEGARDQDLSMAQAQVDQAVAALEGVVRSERTLQQQVDLAEAQVAQAEAELEAIKAPARQQELDIAASQVAQAEAAIRQAEAMIDKTILTAPFAGTVTQLDLRAGEWAMPGMPVASLGDLGGYIIETTDLDEIDVSRVGEGAAVEITFDALPGVELAGTVASVADQSSAGSGGTTYKTVITFQPGDAHLRWGMTAFCDIDTE